MAIHANSTPAPLSPLFTDPFLRRAFERVERDDGAAPVFASRPGPRLPGGSAAALPGLLRGAQRRATVARATLLPEPQTTLSEGFGSPWWYGRGMAEGASARRALSDAIDHAIAILDDLDAAGEDMEDGHDAEVIDEDGEDLEGDDLNLREVDDSLVEVAL